MRTAQTRGNTATLKLELKLERCLRRRHIASDRRETVRVLARGSSAANNSAATFVFALLTAAKAILQLLVLW